MDPQNEFLTVLSSVTPAPLRHRLAQWIRHVAWRLGQVVRGVRRAAF